MLISVIIPFYNCEKYIKQSINSAINQTLSKKYYEIIAINDLAKDNSPKIAKEILNNKKNCRLLKVKKKTVGAGYARNYGLKNSKGKYIYFLDSDDFLKKDALFKLKKILDKNKKIDLVCNNYKVINKSKNKIRNNRFDLHLLKNKNKRKLFENFFDLSIIPQVISNLIKKSTITSKKISFKEGYFEDVNFIFKVLLYSKKRVILKDQIYFKNNRENSIVNTISSKHIKDAFEGYKSAYNFLKKHKKGFFIDNFFLKGLVGETSVLIDRIKSYKITKIKRKKYYAILYRSVKNYLPKIIRNYKFVSKKDIKFKDFINNKDKYF